MKEVVHNVHEYFERLNRKGKTKAPVKRASEATGIEETKVRSILKEKNEKGKFESPPKRYKKSRSDVLDDYEEEKIRKVIYAMYENNEHVTLTKLLKVVRKDQLFLSLASVQN